MTLLKRESRHGPRGKRTAGSACRHLLGLLPLCIASQQRVQRLRRESVQYQPEARAQSGERDQRTAVVHQRQILVTIENVGAVGADGLIELQRIGGAPEEDLMGRPERSPSMSGRCAMPRPQKPRLGQLGWASL